MKNVFKKINKEYIFNAFILLIVIGLYICVFLAIYSNFRERKRQEIANDIIEKIDKEIEKQEETNEPATEIKADYNGVEYTVLGKIKIDKINIYEPILKENTKGSYDASAVKMSGPDLNEFGNVSIGGHNYMRGNFFIKINRLIKNDKITITDLTGRSIDYYVYEYNTTSIDDASYLAQPSSKDEKIITLVTCTQGGKQRYYVKAKAK